MPRTRRNFLARLMIGMVAICGHAPLLHAEGLQAVLQQAAPTLSTQALSAALDALACAQADGEFEHVSRLGVIDYSLPSTAPRLWVFDLDHHRLLYRELVAHGRRSGENQTTQFSNLLGSHQTSLGLFRTGETYVGSNGYSLRLEGLDAGFNDQAMSRAIVMHGAPYVDPALASRQGRIGRSWGCPAVAAGVARPLIDTLKGGQMLFAYYPDPQWLAASRYLNCGATRASRQHTASLDDAPPSQTPRPPAGQAAAWHVAAQ